MKRIFDLFISVFALIILFPIVLSTAILVRIKLGSPILFTQQRPGLHGNLFKMMKFRTMLDAVDKNGEQLPDEQRLTSFGVFLRSTSLDELPGLLNVIKGDMSLVGPRPLLVEYLPLYSKTESQRHNVRPGITGWAQVNGRNTVSWEQRFSYDVWYVENHSFWIDIKILFLTIKKVFVRDGISHLASEAESRFKGHK
ncbi:sugar transferase [Colwellia sp. BRX10-4]|jgi:lipopolysaccharide/colanic/teichoic acid biosynthesis glycosyltransferase|uniref:sugar transferase n=1 Tax=Colwellia sp. BRX10-4 TaxID=2759843 RepID=UPI0015F478F1|nr:sugar transferase [Colwellia sp. BRX10-4]MBA6396527.1 sugar transferase [Colwellia sp. BRX10-4]